MGYAEALEGLGVNVKEGLDRVMDDSDLYEMMLGMFVDMIQESSISLEDFDKPEYEELTKQIHMLKGTTGNLSLNPLFEGYVKILELLRGNDPKEAKAVYEKLLPVQGEIIDCIKQYRNA